MRRVVAHVFVDNLGQLALEDKDVHHLARVLRLRPGEWVTAADGRGGTVLCEWTGSASLSPVGQVELAAPPEPAITVAFSLTKGEHPEWAVQKLTEAGADRVVVMTSERSVVRWEAHAATRQMGRLREVARQAAMQSRRAWLPALDGPVPFAEVAGAGAGLGGGVGGVALAAPGGAPLTLATPTVLIGPEGGWSDAELAAVPAHVGLGPYILRAETAAVAAGVLLAALRARLVSPATPSATAPAET